MSSYQELMAQIDGLKRQAEDVRKQEMAGAIAEIKNLMGQYSITIDELGGAPRAGKVKRAGAGIVKYRDPITGSGWSGRGRNPGWVANLASMGKTLEDCRVE